jgi:septal ring factor EnvC (AmiA/AmiB activator)
MKFVLDFLLKHKKAIAVVIIGVLLIAILVKGLNAASNYFQNKKFAALEQTIQTSEAKVQQLEGQLQVTTATLNTVNTKLQESDARVVDAEARTDQVRTVYVGVRAKGPTFVSPDDAGKVRELTEVLNGLYP